MLPTSEILEAYGDAWCEPDADRRRELLEFCWAENGVYQDPSADVSGREGLLQHIGGLHHSQPGARVEITSGFTEHHGKIHFHWRYVNPQGVTTINGVDFGTLDEDGRICQIVGFFGPPPEK